MTGKTTETTGAAGTDSAAGTWDAAGTMVLRVGYRGADFAGYAEQPGLRTVAGELRGALETLLRRPVELTCAGRTDAGVHALAQHVSLPVTAAELGLDGARVTRALAALTPDDISVRGLYRADAAFSARFTATERGYRYRMAVGARPVHGWGRAWWLRKTAALDVAAMDAAAAALVGEHDFASFCKVASAAAIHADGRSTCRAVTAVSVRAVTECGDDLVAVDIAANAFLHHMVRVVVGSLVEVGRGTRDAAWLAAALAARDRRAAGPTAPAHGLTFERVAYPPGVLAPW